jgi:hypothetical protein
MEEALLVVVRRSDDGEVAERRWTEWHGGTTLQSKREREKGCLSTAISPVAGWRRQRGPGPPESTLMAVTRGGEGGLDWPAWGPSQEARVGEDDQRDEAELRGCSVELGEARNIGDGLRR